MKRPTIFIDDGGVLSDNRLREPQWRRMVADYFTPRLGGDPAAWSAANRAFTDGLFEPSAWRARVRAARDYADFERTYWLDWLGGMCALVGVPTPPEEEAIRLSREASQWITSQVRATFPGARETVRLLHGRGYTLHTASGEPSYDLKTYLSTMGIVDCFDRLYGPDLVNTFKIGPEFYESLLADAGLAPTDAIFVDDSRDAASWANEAGARAVVVNAARRGADSPQIRWVATVSEVPAAIESFD